MGLKTKKGKKGIVAEYISRRKALRNLQISLPIFNRLCIWKGVHPVVPKSLKKAGRGDSTNRLYYKRRDINLLMNEQLLDTLRKLRSHRLKMKNAKARHDRERMRRLLETKPRYNLYGLVRERFGTWESALKCIGNAITMTCAFSRLPKLMSVNMGLNNLSKKITFEWLNLIINVKGMRKVFLQQSNIVIESEILPGTLNRWIMPYSHTPLVIPKDMDIKLVVSQAEFDFCHIISVLMNAYKHFGLVYPPKFQIDDYVGDLTGIKLAESLAFDLKRINNIDKNNEDQIQQDLELAQMDPNMIVGVEEERLKLNKMNLFKDKKVFLNCEVPRDILTIIIRSCGGKVSWQRSECSYVPFPESDETIDYQIIDRPLDIKSMKANRHYVIPQWVVDSLNAGRLLPCNDYAYDAPPIAHVCTIVDSNQSDYVPKELKYLRGEMTAEESRQPDSDDEGDIEEVIDESENEDDMNEFLSDEEDIPEDEIRDLMENKPPAKNQTKKEDPNELKKKREKQMDRKNKELNLPKKHKILYKKIVHSEKEKKKNVEKLSMKRKIHDKTAAKNRKTKNC